MHDDEISEPRRGRSARAAKSFTATERRRGAGDIQKRTAWLGWRIVQWVGAPSPAGPQQDLLYRPAAEIVAEAMQGRKPGVYAIHLRYSDVNPAVAGIALVTPQLVAETLEALQAARRYPHELPRRVGNLEAWRSSAQQRLQAISRVLRSGAGPPGEKSGISLVLPPGAYAGPEDSATFSAEFAWASGSAAPPGTRALLVDMSRSFEQLDGGRAGRGIRRPHHWQWRASLSALAGRASAFCPPDLVSVGVTSWLAACQRAAGDRGVEDIYWMTARALESWLATTEWKRQRLERLFEMLPWVDPLAWEQDRFWNWKSHWLGFIQCHRSIGLLGELKPEQAQRLFAYGLLETATDIAEQAPERLKRLASVEEDWLALSGRLHRKSAWGLLFGLSNDRLTGWLLGQLRSADDAAAERSFCVLHDILLLPSGYLTSRTEREQQPVLQRHLWLYAQLAERHPWNDNFRDDAARLFDLIRVREGVASTGSLKSLSRTFLNAPFPYSASRQELELCSQLSPESTPKFLRILRAIPASAGEYPAEALDGWAYLHAHPAIRGFLAACADHDELVPRLWRALLRLALALRLQLHDHVENALLLWASPPPAASEVPKEIAPLAAYRALAGESDLLPGSVRRLLLWPERRKRELESLRQRRQTGHLTEAARARLAYLEAEGPASASRLIAVRLRRALEKENAPAKLRALETLLDGVIEVHWRRIGLPPEAKLGSPEWDNALHLYASIRKNRRILRSLLMQEARGNRDWIRTHAANAAWLDSMRAKGLNVDRWLAGVLESHNVDGTRWELYTETEPLRVLQMGSLFSTCLSAGRENAYSAVANTVEVNKRVLYIRSAGGVVVGRKLIGLARAPEGSTAKAVLVGFRSYGSREAEEWSPRSGASPWVKILFDLACARLAGEVDAEISLDSAALWSASRTLPLFGHWYNDGPEDPDWWTAGAANLDLPRRLIESTPDLTNRSQREQLVRALIWLGDAAVPVLKYLGRRALPARELRFIARWTQGAAAREFLSTRV